MANDFDAVVIGSGFGGAVSALRLAEGGYRVLEPNSQRAGEPNILSYGNQAVCFEEAHLRHPTKASTMDKMGG